MKSLFVMFSTACIVFTPISAQAGVKYSSQQCKTWFAKVDRNKDGSIGPNENAAGFFDRITLGGASNDSDDAFIMSRTFFLAECAIGSLGKPQS